MRILFLSFYFKPDFCAGSFRAESVVKAINTEKSIISSITLTTQPQRYGKKPKEPKQESFGKVNVYRFWVPQHGNKFIRQIITFLFFAFQSIIKSIQLRNQYDVVFTTSSRMGTMTLGNLVSWMVSKPHYTDIRDVFSDNLSSVLSPTKMNKFILKLFRYNELNVVKRAEWVNFVSPGFFGYFPANLLEGKTHLYTNGIDEVFLQNNNHNEISMPENKRLKIVYAGNIGFGQGLETIVPQVAEMFKNEIEFLIIGDGSSANILSQELQNRDLKNVVMLPPVNRDKLVVHYAEADVLFLHLADIPAFHKVLPSKIFEYSTYNRPILAGASGVAKQFLNDNVTASFVFDPSDLSGAKEKIEKILSFDQLIDRSEFISKYTRSNIMAEMIKSIATCYAS
jgi:glycosyltransferase involved in cell wall biosynthesis